MYDEITPVSYMYILYICPFQRNLTLIKDARMVIVGILNRYYVLDIRM
jgi:hypothetical protein